MERLTPAEAVLFHRTSTDAPPHVGSLVLLPERLGYEQLLNLVESRLQLVPRYRMKVRTVGYGLARPVWVADEDFDIAYHVRRSALPEPGSDEQLYELIGRLLQRPLDPDRPLWEAYVLEGLAGGRSALVTKSHQVVVDGIAHQELAQVLIDSAPSAPDLPPDLWAPHGTPGDVQLLLGAVTNLGLHPAEAAEYARSLLTRVANTGANSVARGLGLRSAMRVLISPAPHTPLNRQTHSARRYAATEFGIDRCQQVARHFDCAVGDVLLATLAGALRRWLLSRDVTVADGLTVRAMVPAGVFGEDTSEVRDMSHWRAGTTRGFVTDLPVGEANPTVRLAQVVHLTERHSQSGYRVQMAAAPTLPEVGPSALHNMSALASATMSRQWFNLPVTLTRAQRAQAYLGGTPVSEIYPIPMVIKGRALAVGLTTYRGRVFVGLTGDRAAMWDLDQLTAAFGEALTELEEIGT